MWIPLETLTLSSNWQFCSESEFGLYRLTPLTEATSLTGNVITGRYEVGQFDADGTGYGIRAFRRESFGVIFQLVKPQFFDTQRIGLRVPTSFYPFEMKIEVNDMSFYSSGNPAGASISVTTQVPASTTAVVISAANPDRKMYSITNQSAKSLFLDFDTEVTLTAYAYEVKPGVVYEMPVPFLGDVRGIWAAGATGNCKVVEFF
jgi:hypothetical protein